jgi:tRNA-specific 2-thiouridylase
MLDKNTVVVAMSGGVDSTAVAMILKKQGYRVKGLHMRVAEDVGEEGHRDFQRVVGALGIEGHVVDLTKPFKTHVTDYFVKAYQEGLTPNPCVACNEHIKFGALLEEAYRLGAYYLATGHYVRLRRRGEAIEVTRPRFREKDQTYMFYNLDQERLRHLLMPLGEVDSKQALRDMVKTLGLTLHKKKDSQEICFIEDKDYGRYLIDHGVKEGRGNFVTEEGEVLGPHRGIVHYTIGQRKGLGISFGRPLYVVEIRPESLEVVLGPDEALYRTGLYLTRVNFIDGGEEFKRPRRVMGKIRYTHRGAPCEAVLEKDRLKVVFDTPQRAVTPGQSMVFYEEDRLLGGGVIE